MKNELLNRITINPEVCQGRPTIRNTRNSVDLILGLLSAGMKVNEILEDYPILKTDDIMAFLPFTSKLSKVKTIQKVVA